MVQQETFQTLISLHLAKTGGQTLEYVLRRQYSPSVFYKFNWYEHVDWQQPNGPSQAVAAFKQIPEDKKQVIRLLHGHLYFGYHHWLSQKSRYITFLRDPVELILSYYYFRPHRMDSIGPFETFIRAHPEADNFQTRILSGDQGLTHYPEFGCCTRSMLETAKRNLETHFILVGLTEHFDESLLMLKRLLGWDSCWYLRQNTTSNRPRKADLNKKTLALIEQNNQLDLELYAFAQTLFEAQRAIYGEGLQEALGRFTWINRTLYPLYAKAGALVQS